MLKVPPPLPTFSTGGPECPGCGRTYTPDEAWYFDETGFDLDCDECGVTFSVQPNCAYSWTSRKVNL
jgi:hypothetical protein